jgi:hypothetical protein
MGQMAEEHLEGRISSIQPEHHSAPEASGEQQGEETLNTNCRGRALRPDCVGEPAQMDEADRRNANADREHTQHAAAQLRWRGAIDDRRLHYAECGRSHAGR